MVLGSGITTLLNLTNGNVLRRPVDSFDNIIIIQHFEYSLGRNPAFCHVAITSFLENHNFFLEIKIKILVQIFRPLRSDNPREVECLLAESLGILTIVTHGFSTFFCVPAVEFASMFAL